MMIPRDALCRTCSRNPLQGRQSGVYWERMGELPFKSHEGRILQDGTARYEENSLKHRFVSSDRRECILFFNTEHGSFDKKRVFVHRLTEEDMENFYLAVGRQ